MTEAVKAATTVPNATILEADDRAEDENTFCRTIDVHHSHFKEGDTEEVERLTLAGPEGNPGELEFICAANMLGGQDPHRHQPAQR